MPITLIRNTKDNAMHGTDNGKYTGCRMKLSGASWYTREGELSDITDLTCERCKEVFATKMIRESNKEEQRIAKEEKKRYQRAKKQGIVREATYEEYLMNREAEASSKRDSRNDQATSMSLQQLRDAIPAENVPSQPSFTAYNPHGASAPQASFDPYASGNSAISAPQAPFDPYAQGSVVSTPQAPFDPYAAGKPVVSAPQAAFDPYANQTPAAGTSQPSFSSYGQTPVVPPQGAFDQFAKGSVVSAPQAPFDPYGYGQPQNMFDPYAQNIAPTASESLQFEAMAAAAAKEEAKAEEPVPAFQEYTGAASVNTSVQNSIPAPAAPAASADDDFLSQFIVKPAAQETPAPAPAASEPVSAENIVSATDDILAQFNIGSQIAEQSPAPSPAPAPVSAAAKADASSFFSDSIPVIGAEYAGASSVNSAVTEFGSLNISETPKDDFVVPNVPVYQPAGNTYVSQNINAFSSKKPEIEEISSPKTPVTDTFNSTPDFSRTEDIMSGFGSAPSTASGFDSVQPVSQSMAAFESVAPMQSSSPAMNSFEYVQPQQNAYGQPGMYQNSYSAPVQNNFGAQPQNQFAQPQNPYAQPQNTGFQMPQGYGTPAPKPAAPAPKPAQKNPVFAPHSGTADSIEEALRQLGAEVNTNNNANNQMPDKEEIVPDFVAYVPSSSKVLHTSAPSQSASSSVPKRPISAREAKQLAKIDAKFKKDLISRGFNPNEIKNGRRGK